MTPAADSADNFETDKKLSMSSGSLFWKYSYYFPSLRVIVLYSFRFASKHINSSIFHCCLAVIFASKPDKVMLKNVAGITDIVDEKKLIAEGNKHHNSQYLMNKPLKQPNQPKPARTTRKPRTRHGKRSVIKQVCWR